MDWMETASLLGNLGEFIGSVAAVVVLIIFVHTQRANFRRATTVGEDGLSQQAVLSVAAEIVTSDTMQREWSSVSAWTRLASPDYVDAVEAAVRAKRKGQYTSYAAEGLPERHS